MLGVSRQRAAVLTERKDFPKPLDRIAAGPVWARTDVSKWARKQGRKLQDVKRAES